MAASIELAGRVAGVGSGLDEDTDGLIDTRYRRQTGLGPGGRHDEVGIEQEHPRIQVQRPANVGGGSTNAPGLAA